MIMQSGRAFERIILASNQANTILLWGKKKKKNARGDDLCENLQLK